MLQRKLSQFFTVFFAFLLLIPSLIVLQAGGSNEPIVGVKEGDWVEYDVIIAGNGSMPPTHDVTWMRMEVLPVYGTAFSLNVTARYSNGTVGSAVWEFNFTEGEVGGWVIIPANLSPGDTFYDLARHSGIPVNVTIENEEQKTVLGAIRTVTCGHDNVREVKEWDKQTGFFIASVEQVKNKTNKNGWYIEDIIVTTKAVATNIWEPKEKTENESGFYEPIILVIAASVLILFSAAAVNRKKRKNQNSLAQISQGKIAILSIIGVFVVEIATILFFPFNSIGLSFAEFNLIMQTFWTAVVLISMWVRKKGKYFVHEITLLIVMSAWIIGFSSVILMDPLSLTSLEAFSNTPLRLIMNILHGVFSVPALIFGIWLVALWRPESTSFPAKTKKLAILTTAFWIPSYIVGVLDFMVLHTTFFG
ncbi:MAG: hypothetical protein NUK63_06175 [Candidatus Bathyarchaeum tardum]|nr:MAG: hypothetical protein NUK63_06175 [Candidatus Bathyarchaeum tardum]